MKKKYPKNKFGCSCIGKTKYKGKGSASKAAAHLRYFHKEYLVPYFCDICHYWHLSSKDNK